MASTPMPDDGVKGPLGQNTELKAQAAPTSPSFWGRKPTPNIAPSLPTPRGPQPYPKLMYHPDPAARAAQGYPIYQTAQDAEQHKEALENGWLDEPTLAHREMLQHGDGGKSGNRMRTAGSDDEPAIRTQEVKWEETKPKKSK